VFSPIYDQVVAIKGSCQVDEERIYIATQINVLSEIECDYNADILKKKLGSKSQIDDGHLTDLFNRANGTLRMLNSELRL
jgi:hypothetical protein